MTYDPRLAVCLRAFATAQNAKAGRITLDQVVQLQAQAVRTLPEGDRLRHDIDRFADGVMRALRDQQALTVLAQELIHGIDTVTQVAPPDLDRRDIHG